MWVSSCMHGGGVLGEAPITELSSADHGGETIPVHKRDFKNSLKG